MTNTHTKATTSLRPLRDWLRIVCTAASKLRIAIIAGALMTTGTACRANDLVTMRDQGAGDPPVLNPPDISPGSQISVPELGSTDRSYVPGDIVIEIHSPDNKWRAFATVTQSETLSMTVLGPSYTRTYEVARPISFSPDGAFLVFSARPAGFIPALHVLPLHPPAEPIQLTNIDLRQIGRPPDPHYIPSPTDEPSQAQWVGRRLWYSEPEGTYELDLDAMRVTRVGP